LIGEVTNNHASTAAIQRTQRNTSPAYSLKKLSTITPFADQSLIYNKSMEKSIHAFVVYLFERL
jgi:hypothetical protein